MSEWLSVHFIQEVWYLFYIQYNSTKAEERRGEERRGEERGGEGRQSDNEIVRAQLRNYRTPGQQDWKTMRPHNYKNTRKDETLWSGGARHSL